MPKSVLISIPTRGDVSVATVEWLLHALGKDVGVDFVVTPHVLESARNQAVLRFLDSRYSHFFTLDSDCIPVTGTI